MATITKRGVSYRICASCGYTPSGRQVRRTMTWTPAPGMTAKQEAKELNRQATLFEEECRSGHILCGNIKFQSFAEQWFKEYAEPKLKRRTIDQYHQYEPRVYAAIGHLKMGAITTRTIQKFIINLGENGINLRTGGRLSPKTVKNTLSFISSVFAYAITQGIIRENPCQCVTLPAPEETERDCYSLEEAEQFLELLENEPLKWRVFFTLAIYGGFRRGELFGFEWKDINFDTGVITVNRTSNYTVKSGVFTDTPKTKGSRRSLKLPAAVLSLLRQFRAAQAEERLQLGDRWIDTDRLFVSWNGKPSHPNLAQNWLTKFCNRTGMRHVSIHSFRHLNASLLINGGADVKTVSAVLGHAQTSTTLNIYAHSFAAAQAAALEAVADTIELHKKQAVNTK
ncbi:site-specific integrase [Anaerotruncus rubiinfantis]|uniref:site-specific integrase n=1 Tax=Anaerotruncus rubiinfantis TaxID=1720200 RepID=UPI0011C6EFDF|nr:site-specific integrase [Anaerotruncus rubiinfantis]